MIIKAMTLIVVVFGILNLMLLCFIFMKKRAELLTVQMRQIEINT